MKVKFDKTPHKPPPTPKPRAKVQNPQSFSRLMKPIDPKQKDNNMIIRRGFKFILSANQLAIKLEVVEKIAAGMK